MKQYVYRFWFSLAALLAVAIALTACSAAITPPPPTPTPVLAGATVVASGLYSPRQLFYAPDGTLYIAEAGHAGDGKIVADPEHTVGAGLTGQISAVSPDGKQSVILPGLPSIEMQPNSSDFRGSQAIYVTDDSYWVGFGEGPSQAAVRGLPFFRRVVQFDRKTWRVKQTIDTLAAATEAKQPEPASVDSDPTDITMTKDGALLIADAGCNCLWSWTKDGGLKLATSWKSDDNPVPTGVSVGPDGDIYVSFLSGFPYKAGSARIERWSDGKLKQTYGGLNLVTDVLVTGDGSIYAVQLASGSSDRGFVPNSGSVIEIADSGPQTLMDGLPTPYGLAQAPDGTLVVSVFSTGDKEGQGMVIKVK